MAHFVLFPLMSPGHMIPMMDLARLLARQGIAVTAVTTPRNAARHRRSLAGDASVRMEELELPGEEAGLPSGCESFDELPSLGMGFNFFTAAHMLRGPAEALFERLEPSPTCIISDPCLPWTMQIAKKFNIPRLSFHAISCFCLICVNSLQYLPEILENLKSETDPFVLPGLPHRVEFTKPQLPMDPDPRFKEFGEQIVAAEKDSHGVVINTFEELEPEYVEMYRKITKGKVWCVGPVSLCNEEDSDKFERGNEASIGREQCSAWLDSRGPCSVLYACLGSLCNLIPAQLVELGLGLEASGKPFIWAIREKSLTKELEDWISEYKFEERTRGRGMVIRGWAPQALILAHQAVGGFLTHCGWNSSIEALCAGVPVATWPLFADQFANEKFLVDVLKVGVKVGAERMVNWGVEEEVGVLVRSERVGRAVEELMGGGDEVEERRGRARRVAGSAKRAVEEGGSSWLSIRLMVQDIMGQQQA